LFAQGIPLSAFEVSDIRAEFARLTAHGVAFTLEPTSPAGAGHESRCSPTPAAI
jgi:hypothetical protein